MHISLVVVTFLFRIPPFPAALSHFDFFSSHLRPSLDSHFISVRRLPGLNILCPQRQLSFLSSACTFFILVGPHIIQSLVSLNLLLRPVPGASPFIQFSGCVHKPRTCNPRLRLHFSSLASSLASSMHTVSLGNFV